MGRAVTQGLLLLCAGAAFGCPDAAEDEPARPTALEWPRPSAPAGAGAITAAEAKGPNGIGGGLSTRTGAGTERRAPVTSSPLGAPIAGGGTARPRDEVTCPAEDRDLLDLCWNVFDALVLECGEGTVPMVVDALVELDWPPGTAQRGGGDEGRHALVAEYARHWKTADLVSVRTEICSNVFVRTVGEEMRAHRSAVEACLVHDGCRERVACFRPVQHALTAALRKKWRSGSAVVPAPAVPPVGGTAFPQRR